MCLCKDFKLFDNGLKLDISSFTHMNIRMSSKGKRPLRSLTPGDKIIAIQRIHDGESKASVARDIGVPESTLRGWCKNEDKLRFMSRQSSIDNMPTDSVSEKVDIGPPDKRRKIDTIPLPLNFSNKIPFESANGLDYSTNKALSDLTLHGMTLDYAAFTNVVRNKVFGTDMQRSTDISLNTINSPLSNLSHLGIGGISQSPLTINFNEISSNFNLLAQLNPSLAAMSGLNATNTPPNALHTVKSTKNISTSQQLNGSQNETNDRQHGLAVKNWANQRNTSTNEVTYEMSLPQSSRENNKMKCPSPSIAPSLGCSFPHLQEDPLLYWLKSQQAILGLSSLYTQSAPPFISPPIRSSTPQQSGQTESTPQTPLTPSSTPSGSLDDKNTAWFNWCKAFGATLNTLNSPVSSQINTTQSNNVDSSIVPPIQSPSFENILYSQLTKESAISPSTTSQNKEHLATLECEKKEDNLSSKYSFNNRIISKSSPLPTPAHSPIRTHSYSPSEGESKSSIIQNIISDNPQQNSRTLVECKDVLDNLLFKINKAAASRNGNSTPSSIDGENDTESYISMKICNNNDLNANNNNNNNSNKTDEKENKMEKISTNLDDNVSEAIQHGEKFLNWLEKCSNPRVTTVHIMQLRFLIASIKSGISNENCSNSMECLQNEMTNKNSSSHMHPEDNNLEECHRSRRK